MADQNPPSLVVTFKSHTPVVGIEFNPRVNEKDEFTYQYKWERPTNRVKCFVHKSENATMQCLECVQVNLATEGSYHCSVECYKDTWKYHDRLHKEARASKKTFDANDKIGKRSGLMSDDDIVVNQGGTSWLEVASTRTYVPSAHDFGRVLRFSTLVIETGTSDVKITDPVIALPSIPSRAMIRTIPDSRYNSAQRTFKILSYNILADYYAKTDDLQGKLSDHPKWCLQWEYRRENLFHEIMAYNADIICLQEVQDNHFEDFRNKLQDHGYSVVHKFKNFGNFDIDGKITVTDGCATFFRFTKFKKLEEFELEYGKHKTIGSSRWLKDNVAIVIKLKLIGIGDPSSNFYVANTHIHSNEEFKDAKLFQVSTLVHELEKFSLPVLLCGDLNSCPGSAPYDFVVNGEVDYNHCQFPHEHRDILHALKLDHELSLRSAYAAVAPPGMPREQFTHFSKDFQETLDYIFYTGNKFWLKGVLEIPDIRRELKKHIPSPSWSSDHVAIMAELELVPSPLDFYWV